MEHQARYNPLTAEWVVIAPGRDKRPDNFKLPERRPKQPPRQDPQCPFCPGNESALPEILDEVTDEDGRWRVRAAPNKFPALVSAGGVQRRGGPLDTHMDGVGRHEVIIEHPRHDYGWAHFSQEHGEMVLQLMQRRYCQVQADARMQAIILFRNHGAMAGTSLIHPHAQLMATGFIPQEVSRRQAAAAAYFGRTGSCALCDAVQWEQEQGQRIVHADDRCVAFAPFAAGVRGETWIVPLRHRADFSQAEPGDLQAVAKALRLVIRAYKQALGDPDFNFIVNTAHHSLAGAAQNHWHIQVLPRLSFRAGFEIGSGIRINPVAPEDDAALLRSNLPRET